MAEIATAGHMEGGRRGRRRVLALASGMLLAAMVCVLVVQGQGRGSKGDVFELEVQTPPSPPLEPSSLGSAAQGGAARHNAHAFHLRPVCTHHLFHFLHSWCSAKVGKSGGGKCRVVAADSGRHPNRDVVHFIELRGAGIKARELTTANII